jgi:hypothetical protein
MKKQDLQQIGKIWSNILIASCKKFSVEEQVKMLKLLREKIDSRLKELEDDES